MASSKEYLLFVREQLSALERVSSRPMMGEYLLYYRGCVIGGVYDDRFLLKATPSALRLLAEAGLEPQYELPYPGAGQMLLADADDSALCCRLAAAIAGDLGGKGKRT